MAVLPASSHGADLAQANTWTGNQTAPAWIASGLTGATAASRYVGATASGAPGSGTFAVGDFIIDQSGKIYVCTVAGSPGTWVQTGGSGGVTVDSYVTFTSGVSITGTTAGSPTTVVTAAAFTADGSSTYCIEFFCYDVTASGANWFALFNLYEGATEIGRVVGMGNAASGQFDGPAFGRRFIVPSAASHTYFIGAYKSGTVTANAGTGASGTDNAPPGYIRITHGG